MKHGYAFFYSFRRRHGPSADQALLMQDVLHRGEEAKGCKAACVSRIWLSLQIFAAQDQQIFSRLLMMKRRNLFVG